MEENNGNKRTPYYWFLAAFVIFVTIFLNLFIGEWKLWLLIMQVVAILLFVLEGIVNLQQYRRDEEIRTEEEKEKTKS